MFSFVIGGNLGCKLKEGEFDPPFEPPHEAVQNQAEVVKTEGSLCVCPQDDLVMPVDVCFVVGRERGQKGGFFMSPDVIQVTK
jgi:hypothetical protein